MPKVPYPYEVNGKSVTGNGFLIPICSLSNRSLLPSLTVHYNIVQHTVQSSSIKQLHTQLFYTVLSSKKKENK